MYAYVKGVADLLLSGRRAYESMQAENWAVSHPEHVRQYREQEARYAADRRQTGRNKTPSRSVTESQVFFRNRSVGLTLPERSTPRMYQYSHHWRSQ
ncbi:MAG: hypothetical protein ACK5YR_02645 [Pirellula sp.]